MSHFDYRPSYRRNLPHIQPPGVKLFITFRLAGSLPHSVIEQYQHERQWLSHIAMTNPGHYDRVKDDFERAWFVKFERILDHDTTGPTWLSDDRVAEVVSESLHYRDGKVYLLDTFTIMSNHVHAVVKPLSHDDTSYHSLSSIMQSLKGYTAFKANRILRRGGEFWAHESYDHWIRGTEEWQRIIAYVLNNPVKAGYVDSWLDWKWNYRRA